MPMMLAPRSSAPGTRTIPAGTSPCGGSRKRILAHHVQAAPVASAKPGLTAFQRK